MRRANLFLFCEKEEVERPTIEIDRDEGKGMNKGVGMLISAIILQLLAFRSLVAAAQSHYEGLELLKRYAVDNTFDFCTIVNNDLFPTVGYCQE